jgi:hypothetical protein
MASGPMKKGKPPGGECRPGAFSLVSFGLQSGAKEPWAPRRPWVSPTLDELHQVAGIVTNERAFVPIVHDYIPYHVTSFAFSSAMKPSMSWTA